MKIGQTLNKRLHVLLACWLLVPTLANAQRIEYYHLDALGSVRAVTDENADVIERHDYLPYGEEWNPEPSTNSRKFTGKERDEETGFDYFGARYYESQLARFTTIDPALTFAENRVDPQRWNRYAYVRNNPLRYVDPDGKILETPWDIFNITLGLASLGANVAVGNVGGAAADAVGLAIDVAAAIAPGVPGGAGTTLRAIRGADKVADLTKTARRGYQWTRSGTQATSQGFRSFSAFKRAAGRAGPGRQWHHVVEQTPNNLSRFGADTIHNNSNLIPVDIETHRRISGFFSSKQPFTQGSTVRQWLGTRSLEQQTKFGQEVLERFAKK